MARLGADVGSLARENTDTKTYNVTDASFEFLQLFRYEYLLVAICAVDSTGIVAAGNVKVLSNCV